MALMRSIPAGMQAALDSGVFYPVMLVHLDWPDGPIFAHSSVGTITFDGEDWLGVGEFGAISLPEEGGGLAISPASFKLLGVPDEIFDRLDDPVRNRDVRVLFGCVTERTGNVLVADPVEVFVGYMDAMRYSATVQSGETMHGIELTAATGPSARASASIYHSLEDQVLLFPADTLFIQLIHNEAKSFGLTWPES